MQKFESSRFNGVAVIAKTHIHTHTHTQTHILPNLGNTREKNFAVIDNPIALVSVTDSSTFCNYFHRRFINQLININQLIKTIQRKTVTYQWNSEFRYQLLTSFTTDKDQAISTSSRLVHFGTHDKWLDISQDNTYNRTNHRI